MSIYQKASLVQIPSGYKAADDKLYSVVPANGDGDFTVSADADATRVNADGLIESVSADQARLNYNFIDGVVQPDPHLLLEPTRENIIQYSELFSNSYWTKENVTIGTGLVSPDGGSNAQNLIENTSNGRHRVRASLSVSSGTTYNLSVWAKSSNRNLVINADVLINARSGFDLINGTVQNTTSGTATIKEFPNGWYLCTVKGTATTTQTTVAYIQAQIGTTDANYTGDGTSTLSLFGAQLEEGSYATSYIPTSGSAVTRTRDNAFNGGTDSVFNLTEGTLFFDVEVFRPINDSQRLISLSDGGSFNRVLAIPKDTENTMRYFFEIGGNQDEVTLGFSYNTRQKIAIAYGGGNIKIYRDGSQQSSRTSGTTFTDLDRINFSDVNNFPKATAKIYQTMYFNEKLSDAELITLTS